MKTRKKRYTYHVDVDLYDCCHFKILKREKKKGNENLPFNEMTDALKYAISNIESTIQETLSEAECLEQEAEEMETNKQKLLKRLQKLKE